MSTWRTLPAGLPIMEYAKQVCDEIKLPHAGNLALMRDCILSRGVGEWQGFQEIMRAVELARRLGYNVRNRWWWQDGRYNEFLPGGEYYQATEAEPPQIAPESLEPPVKGVVH